MTMKGKEKKQEGRVTRSKSPARRLPSATREPPSPPGSTPSKQRVRGRSRSRSPARTPAKAGITKAEPAVRQSRKSETIASATSTTDGGKSRKVITVEHASSTVVKTSRNSEVLVEEKMTRSASRAAAAAGLSVLTQRKTEIDAATTKVDEDKTKKTEKPAQQASWLLSNFVGCGVMTMLILVVVTTGLMCTLLKCSVYQLPRLPTSSTDYFNLNAVLIVLGWALLQLVLSCLPLGWTRTGGLLLDGTNIRYRCNGPSALILTSLVLGTLYYVKLPVFRTFSKLFTQIMFTGICLAFIISVWLHIRAKRQPANQLSASGRTGLLAFLYGREVLPRVGPFNVKIFGVIHMGFLGWAAIIGITAVEAYQRSTWNSAFVAVAVMQFVYILDFILFQASLSDSLMISKDATGFVFVFMSFVWLPFIHSFQLRYLLANSNIKTSYPVLGAAIGLFVVGYFIARLSNLTKDKFRQQKLNVAFSSYQIIPTSSGKPLLASGLWGLCRHPNYLGCLLMATAWSLPCGLYSPVTYVFVLYMLVVFVSRTLRDGNFCQQKHGSVAWTQYCQRVRSRIIPLIY